jgi:hypothetical protein
MFLCGPPRGMKAVAATKEANVTPGVLLLPERPGENFILV